MTLYDIHLILPEATEFDNMPEPLQDQLNALDTRWPSFPGIGTKSSDGKKLIHARIRHPILSKVVLEGLFIAFGLSWEVAGIREARKTQATYDSDGEVLQEAYYSVVEHIDKATILPYIADISELGEDDEIITRTATLADVIYLPMYAGVDPIQLI